MNCRIQINLRRDVWICRLEMIWITLDIAVLIIVYNPSIELTLEHSLLLNHIKKERRPSFPVIVSGVRFLNMIHCIPVIESNQPGNTTFPRWSSCGCRFALWGDFGTYAGLYLASFGEKCTSFPYQDGWVKRYPFLQLHSCEQAKTIQKEDCSTWKQDCWSKIA